MLAGPSVAARHCLLCLTTLGFTPRGLAVLTEHAVGAAFLEGAARERLRARVRAGWASLAGWAWRPGPGSDLDLRTMPPAGGPKPGWMAVEA
jgi:hypothetical protein